MDRTIAASKQIACTSKQKKAHFFHRNPIVYVCWEKLLFTMSYLGQRAAPITSTQHFTARVSLLTLRRSIRTNHTTFWRHIWIFRTFPKFVCHFRIHPRLGRKFLGPGDAAIAGISGSEVTRNVGIANGGCGIAGVARGAAMLLVRAANGLEGKWNYCI